MSKYRDFSSNYWNTIKNTIDELITKSESPFYAAFDADGTLWGADAGESFFDFQIKHCNLKNLPSDPWQHYHQWKETDTRAAYLWLAQINKGCSLADVRKWARQCRDQNKDWPLFEPKRKLIEWLKSRGVRVFVITASIKWAVEPFAELMGLHYDDVLGVQTEIVDGIVTEKQKGPITWKEGKAQALLDLTQGVQPILCSGNTLGDTALIQSSQGIKLAVTSAKQNEELYKPEMELQKIALAQNWLAHSF